MELLLKALLLGIAEGLTEFLPVSSTGHLILLGHALDFTEIPGNVFEIVIQLGAILAICVLYRQKLVDVLSGLVRKEKGAIDFTINILLAFLPAMVLGYFLHGFIKEALFNPSVVASTLILGGFAIIIIEKTVRAHHIDSVDAMTKSMALKVGFCQTLAMVPGVSRSAATIMGARILGVARRPAAEFSFFLAVPTMLAATVYDVYKNFDVVAQAEGASAIAVGFIAALISALLVVKAALAFIEKYGFIPFAYYRIALGIIVWLVMV